MAESDYRIEQFTLNEETEKDVLEVLRKAYLNVYSDEGGTTEFTYTMFNILFNSPYMPKDLFIRAVHKPSGKVVGFVGGIPRDLYYKGKTYKVGFPSFLAVDPEHRQQRLAFKMVAKLIEVGKERDFEAGVAFFEPEEHGISTGQAIAREMGIPFITLQRIKKFLIRVFDAEKIASVTRLKWYEKLGLKFFEPLKKVRSDSVKKCLPESYEEIYELFKDFTRHTDMSLLRDRDDFVWYLQQPGVNCVAYYGDGGKVRGFATAFEFLLSGFGNSIKFGWIDMVHTYNLTKKEASDLIRYFAITSKEMGWEGLQTPFIPYFDPAPFKKANFLFFPKDLVVALFPLKNNIKIEEPVKTFYFNWR